MVLQFSSMAESKSERQHSSLYGISHNYRLPLFVRPGGEVKYLLLGINGEGGRFLRVGPVLHS